MINLEKSIIIHRPVEEVFAYVSDLTHSAEWQAGLLEVHKITENPLGVGTKYTFVRIFMGRKMEASNELTEFVENVKVSFKTISGPIPGEASYIFEHAGLDTKLTSKIEMHTGGFISLAEPLISASLQRDMAASFTYLKDLLENQVIVAEAQSNS